MIQFDTKHSIMASFAFALIISVPIFFVGCTDVDNDMLMTLVTFGFFVEFFVCAFVIFYLFLHGEDF